MQNHSPGIGKPGEVTRLRHLPSNKGLAQLTGPKAVSAWPLQPFDILTCQTAQCSARTDWPRLICGIGIPVFGLMTIHASGWTRTGRTLARQPLHRRRGQRHLAEPLEYLRRHPGRHSLKYQPVVFGRHPGSPGAREVQRNCRYRAGAARIARLAATSRVEPETPVERYAHKASCRQPVTGGSTIPIFSVGSGAIGSQPGAEMAGTASAGHGLLSSAKRPPSSSRLSGAVVRNFEALVLVGAVDPCSFYLDPAHLDHPLARCGVAGRHLRGG